jgi:hypothetical protein
MRALILLLTFFTGFQTLSSQITLDSAAYFPAIGDTLQVAVDNAPVGITITGPGGDQSWNFATLQSGFTQEQIVRALDPEDSLNVFPNANLTFEQANSGLGYYRSSATSFALEGFVGEDPIAQGLQVQAPFAPPYVERWAPLAFFDVRNMESNLLLALAVDDIPGGLFDNLPIRPDSVRVRANIRRTDVVDAWGSLTIPGGNYEVLREKRSEVRDIRLETKVGSFPWLDITDLAIGQLPIPGIGRDTTVSYYFWSDAAKEPIALIESDAEGQTVQSVTYKDNGVISNVLSPQDTKPRVAVYPNPAIISARFEFVNLPADRYTLELYNLAGARVWSNNYYIEDYLLERVNVSQLRKGMYLYVLRNSRGERIAVKRLVVATP